MCAAWVVLQITVLFFYKNLNDFDVNITPVLNINQSVSEAMPISRTENANTSYGSTTSNTHESNEVNHDRLNEIAVVGVDEETSRHIIGHKETDTLITRSPSVKLKIVDNSESGPFLVRIYNEYIKEEVVAVLSSTFCVFLMQTALEVFFFGNRNALMHINHKYKMLRSNISINILPTWD